MKLNILITVLVLLAAVKSTPIIYPENINHNNKDAENFVLIGGSSSSEKLKPKIEDDKVFRSGHYYSLLPIALAATKPNADYHGHPAGHHPHPTNGLVNANVQLLEPFMLVTFLLFVLCLIDKARPHTLPLSRIDRDYLLYEGYSNYVKRNQSDF